MICTAAEAADQLSRPRSGGRQPAPRAGASATPSPSASAGAAGETPAPDATAATGPPRRRPRTCRLPDRAPRRRPGAGAAVAAAHRGLRPGAGGRRPRRQGDRRDAARDHRAARRPCGASWPRCRTTTASSPCASPAARSPPGATRRARSPRRSPCARCWPSTRTPARPAPSWTCRSPTGPCQAGARQAGPPVMVESQFNQWSSRGRRADPVRRCLTPPRGVGMVNRRSGHQVFPAVLVLQESLQRRLFLGGFAE